jgi:hypothetical protein
LNSNRRRQNQTGPKKNFLRRARAVSSLVVDGTPCRPRRVAAQF